MVRITVEYTGDLHTRALHGPSGRSLETDAPVDNQGRGETFSPTDLVATALGTCIATTMGIAARRHDIDLRGLKIEVVKEMSTDTPRRIHRLPVRIEMPVPGDHPHRTLLENTAKACPVHHSLHPGIEIPIEWVWAS